MCALDRELRSGATGSTLTQPWTKETKRYVRRVVQAIRPTCIILHGSMARGTDKDSSDVDLVVVGGTLPPKFLERLRLLIELDDTSVPIEALAYTVDEFDQMLHSFHVTALDALEFGIPLHGRRYFQKMRRVFEGMKARGLRRTACTWDWSRLAQEAGIRLLVTSKGDEPREKSVDVSGG